MCCLWKLAICGFNLPHWLKSVINWIVEHFSIILHIQLFIKYFDLKNPSIMILIYFFLIRSVFFLYCTSQSFTIKRGVSPLFFSLQTLFWLVELPDAHSKTRVSAVQWFKGSTFNPSYDFHIFIQGVRIYLSY